MTNPQEVYGVVAQELQKDPQSPVFGPLIAHFHFATGQQDALEKLIG